MIYNMKNNILLKDLCARLPYNVKIETLDDPQIFDIRWLSINMCNIANPYLPYLFPLSSITKEQMEELIKLINTGQNANNEFMRSLCRIEFYHKYHFDYRGLIPMGLAIDATNLNIYCN